MAYILKLINGKYFVCLRKHPNICYDENFMSKEFAIDIIKQNAKDKVNSKKIRLIIKRKFRL